MKLYYTHASPFARSARIVVREHGLEGKVDEVVSHPFDGAEDFIKANPLGKVPCLVLDNGQAIMDSEVICAYLDRELGDGRLGRALEADWAVRTFYSVCSGLLDTLVLLRLEKVRDAEGLRSVFWWGRYQAAIARTLDYLEAHTAALPDEVSLAQINLACAINYIGLRHAEIDWRHGRSALARLVDQLEQRESLVATRLHD